MSCQQVRRTTPDEDPVDLDRLPTLRQHHRPAAPLGRFLRAKSESRQAVETAHQEAAEVGHEGTDARLVGKSLPTELVGFAKRLLDAVGIAPLEPALGFGTVAE